ncbi:peptidase S41 [Massilia forsythiae]|uniref:Peptidase S41 n=1 Tax=Massilia forsythiae TaxID=2728020 RepID=A0A7Z2VV29_9BURK|nr:S41 family peptidase [Massilia forsythiae]QJD99765.1 peptidase S41 [Massilia forsythiae]
MTSPFAISPFASGRATAVSRLAACAAAVLLSACGGGGGGSSGSASAVGTTPVATTTPATPSTPGTTTRTPDIIPTDFTNYQNLCAAPRTGVDSNGLTYPDRQGTLLDELKFLRGWADRYYLWYNEIPNDFYMADFTNTLDYFAKLKTPALTASGKPKDQFHFTYTTAEWNALSTAGEEVGYGVTWSRSSTTAPRTWLATIVEPGSPAAAAGIRRGDMLTAVDGIDFVNTSDKPGVAAINAGLFPEHAGETHKLSIQRAGATFDVTINASVVSSASVKSAKVIDTATGKIGYLSFEDHNAVAEKQLIDTFTTFRNQGVTDLVLDMRYNGGGLLYIASELGYMIAGPSSASKTFERPVYNSKTAPQSAIPFRNTAYGFASPNPVPAGQALPYLNLKHVTVLTTAGTCSASEAVINGLRGIDVDVTIIGAATCGKPYGFTPVDNCGTTYFSIEFQGVNAKGFGDYADGFAPTCTVADDLSHAIGDTGEGLLAAALAYRTGNTCPTSRARAVPMELVRSQAKEIAVLPRVRQ